MKNIKKNIAIIGVVGLLMCTGLNLNAQRNMRLNKDCPKGIEYSDQQKEQIKKSKIEFAKATKDLKNELNELRARQNTLMSADKPDVKAIYANIDKVSDLKNKLRKEQFAMRVDVKSVLTDEQKAMILDCPMGKQGLRQGRKGNMPNGQGRMDKDGMRGKGGMTQGQGIENGPEFGHKGMPQDCPNSNWMNLSDEQKVQMKDLRIAHWSESKELRDQMEMLQLKQKQIMTSENIDEKMIIENMDRLSEIQNKLAKMKVDHNMEVRKFLTEDQLTLFLSHSGKGQDFGNRNRHRRFNN
ncbi:periplasmic heavy metal sensor [Labilibaculum sp. K2S]|uniref:Spy/CpxP family protein refolding chaperone n=1 Tax=Labilibaculum sp. K2S TaxID=3056386 RepID=UPI0025A47781|nr:periplasmic heavy metal sensor [Labilibaculum sp. K2S]MDM8161122.1 periplasmic heavy metal sensor [Labilibaculum sp. K2S]